MSAAEDFAQYKLHFVDDIQHDYEVIRPIVLFAETVAERSRQTGIERRFPRSEILQQSEMRRRSFCPEHRMTCDGKVDRFILPSG